MDTTFLKQRYLANPEDAITVAHIPARGGSVRVPGKNTHLLGGAPLIAYTICLARALRGVDRILVNTDSEEIAAVAREYGAEVPFLRPAELSHERANLQDAQQYAADWLLAHGATIGRFVELYPTSPFRSLQRTQTMLDELHRRAMVGTMIRIPFQWDRLCMERQDGAIALVDQEARARGGAAAPSVDAALANTYRRFLREHYPHSEHLADGPLATIKRTGHFIGMGFHENYAEDGDACYFEIEDPLERIDIDTAEDFALAEEALARFDFGFTIARPGELCG